MYPILFDAAATTYTTQGLGVLSSAIECTVTEERNGIYELFMRYPESGVHYSEIVHSAILVVIPSDGASRQAFRIYKISRPINGIVSVYAQHISYQLSYIPVSPFTASTPAETFAGFRSHALEACPFTFETDIASNATYSQTVPESIRARLGGQQGSVLDVYGGEYEWDNYTVHLWKARGTESGATLRYGKNITDLKQDESIENTYTGICPYWKNDEELVTLPEGVIHASTAENFPFQRTIPVDFSGQWEDPPTVEQLRSAAQTYIRKNKIGIPSVSLSVSFVALWQTLEYKDVAPLERVKLCDTLSVYFEKLGITTTAKVNKTVFDVIRERYTSIDIGETRHTLTSTVADTTTELETTAKELTAETQKAINTSTKLITGQKGGYVLLHLDPQSRKPYEILIMDTDDIATAKKVWRWNNAGWGYSSNGYNGDFNLAATIDGTIVADFIKAGTMEADRIKGGTLTLGGEENINGVLEVKDSEGTVRGKWSNHGIRSLWLDPDDHVPTDYISINGEQRGVVLIQDVTENSTIDNPIKKARGRQLKLSSFNLIFEDRDGLRGTVDENGCSFEWDENTSSDYAASSAWVHGPLDVVGDLNVQGQKDRAVMTDFGMICLASYETATPYFGDIGSGVCDDTGCCYIDIDARLADVCNVSEYHVFISPYDSAGLTVERHPGFFVVKGEPGAAFSWEVKAKQLQYENNRFEVRDPNKPQKDTDPDPGVLAADYLIYQQEEMMNANTEEESADE